MKKTLTFSERLNRGATKLELMNQYCLSEKQYEGVVQNLQKFHTTGALSAPVSIANKNPFRSHRRR